MDKAEPGRPKPRPGVWVIAAGIVGAIVLIALLVALLLYAVRGRVAASLARQWLGKQGVPSNLDIQSLSLTGLRAKLRLGDPADPDLTVDEMDLAYSLSGPWNGRALGLDPHRIRLVGAHLKLRLKDGKVSAGGLDPLVRNLSRPSAKAGPAPDVIVENSTVLVVTPGGDLRLTGNGQRVAGVIAAHAQAAPFQIAGFGGQARGAGGRIDIDQHGAHISATANLAALTVSKAKSAASAGWTTLGADLPAPDKDGRWSGPMRVNVTAKDLSATGDGRLDGGSLAASFDGVVNTNAVGQGFRGHLTAKVDADALTRKDAAAKGAHIDLDLPKLILAHDAAGGSASGDGTASLKAASLAVAGGHGSAVSGHIRITGLSAATRKGRTTASAALDGGLAGDGALDPALARRLARGVPVLSGEAPYAAAMERGLRGFHVNAASWRAEVSDRGARIALTQPILIQARSGARVTLASGGEPVILTTGSARGALNLDLGGGGLPALKASFSHTMVSHAGFLSEVAVKGSLDALIARGATLSAHGYAGLVDGRFRFALIDCAPVTATKLDLGANPVTGFSGQVCPGDGPLIEAANGGWKAEGRLQGAAGDAPSFAVTAKDANGAFRAAGAHDGLDTARLTVARAEIRDTTQPLRFHPAYATGGLSLASHHWTGDFTAATPAGWRIGGLHIVHDADTGAGRADVTATLAFVPGGPQPAALSPLADFARETEGSAMFTGWFAWDAKAATSSGGELVARIARVKGPLGPMTNTAADIHFTSLAPLATAPDQTLTVGEVQALTPVSDITATFDLDGPTLHLRGDDARLAGGHVHLEPMTLALDKTKGVINGVLVLDKVDIGQIIAASSLADAVQIQARIDGRIPFELGPAGVRIHQGSLVAAGPGRLSISRKALTGANASVAQGQAGFAQDLAYQAMDNLSFDQLDATMNSIAGERLGVLFHIKGRHDPPTHQSATIAVGDLIGGKALDKPIPLPSDTQINLTLDTSLNFGELVAALDQAWRDSLAGNGPGGRSPVVQGETPSVTTK